MPSTRVNPAGVPQAAAVWWSTPATPSASRNRIVQESSATPVRAEVTPRVALSEANSPSQVRI